MDSPLKVLYMNRPYLSIPGLFLGAGTPLGNLL